MTTKPMIPRDGWYRTQAGHLVKVTLDRFKLKTARRLAKEMRAMLHAATP